jgi:hypothetical protein
MGVLRIIDPKAQFKKKFSQITSDGVFSLEKMAIKFFLEHKTK